MAGATLPGKICPRKNEQAQHEGCHERIGEAPGEEAVLCRPVPAPRHIHQDYLKSEKAWLLADRRVPVHPSDIQDWVIPDMPSPEPGKIYLCGQFVPAQPLTTRDGLGLSGSRVLKAPFEVPAE